MTSSVSPPSTDSGFDAAAAPPGRGEGRRPTAFDTLAAWASRVAHANWFRGVVIGLILAVGVVVGLETYFPAGTPLGDTLLAIDFVILVLFTVEIVVRMLAHGRAPWRFFSGPDAGWNSFDFLIVAVCWLPAAGHYAAVLRLARVFRLLRLFSAVPRLQVIVTALLHAIPSIAYVGVLMALLFYMYAVIGVALFGKNDPIHFGTLHDAMISLFRTITLEDWTDLMYINMVGSDNYGYAAAREVERVSRAQPVVSVMYFTSFVLLGTMIVLNLFIGIVLSSMNEAQAAQAKRLAERRLERASSSGDSRAAAIERSRAELDELAIESSRLGDRIRAVRGALPTDPPQPPVAGSTNEDDVSLGVDDRR